VSVVVRGGDHLDVSFAEEASGFKDVKLSGPATFVFAGRVEI
jgi:diaminopimelate epimerase